MSQESSISQHMQELEIEKKRYTAEWISEVVCNYIFLLSRCLMTELS